MAPDDHRATSSLAVLDLREGALTAARDRLRRVVRMQPRLVSGWRNLAAACQGLGHWAEAEQALRRVIALDPPAIEARFALAQAQITLGRTAAALAEVRRLTAEPEVRARALASLGGSWPETVTAGEADDMVQAAQDGATVPDLRVGLWFALGAVREAQGNDAAAFAAFAEGNRLQHAILSAGPRGRRPADVLAEHLEAGAHVRAVMTAAALGAPPGEVGDAPGVAEPIFVVGMPRSGSTLVEQILASHPDVVGLGELATLPALLEQIYPAAPGDGFAESLEAVAQRYLRSARERGWDGRRRFVDKTLENHLHVGVIRRMFPRAVILRSVRDPIDTCVGIWRQRFTRGAETSYDFADIAAEYHEYRRMADHWRDVAPGAVVDIALEDLVADPEAVTRWLVSEVCGLAWNGACLRFWTTARPVRTASARQVRQPISSAVVGRWRRYEPWLGPLREALAPGLPR